MFAEQAFQSVQSRIRQRGTDDPALRCSFRGGEENVFLQEAGLQPLLEDDFVHRDVRQQPAMANSVKARLDIALEHPTSTVSATQNNEALLPCVGAAAF